MHVTAVPKGVEPSSSGRQPDIMSRYTTGPDGRNYWLRSSVSALSAQCSAIEPSSYMVGRAGFEPANPEEAELQSAAFSHLRYLPNDAQQKCRSPHRIVLSVFETGLQAAAVCCAYGAVHRIRTCKPAGQRFSGPLPHRPDTQRKNGRGRGIRTQKSLTVLETAVLPLNDTPVMA